MQILNIQDSRAILDLTRECDFVIIGEMHGSRQNASLIGKLLQILLNNSRPITVAFEWALSERELQDLRLYIQTGEVPDTIPDFFLNSDGRFTLEHANLLRKIHDLNNQAVLIDIYTFDTETNDATDQDMAASLNTYRNANPGTLILAITGNMHARKLPSEKVVEPMASILDKKYCIVSIFLQYLSGTIMVEHEERDVTKAASQQEGPGTNFDAVIQVAFSEAAAAPMSLQQIKVLL